MSSPLRRSRTRSGSAGLSRCGLLQPPPSLLVTADSPPYFTAARRSQSCRVTGSRPTVHVRRLGSRGSEGGTSIAESLATGDSAQPKDSLVSAQKVRPISDSSLCRKNSGSAPVIVEERLSLTSEVDNVWAASNEFLVDQWRKSSRPPSVQIPADGDESYRLRNFSLTPKGFVNRGDSFRRRRRSFNSSEDGGATGRPQDPADTAHTVEPLLVRREYGPVQRYIVVLVGSSGVGKTSLVDQLLTSESINAYDLDQEPGQLHETKNVCVELDGEESELQLVTLTDCQDDLCAAGVPDGVVLIYSVIDKMSFDVVRSQLARAEALEVLKHTCLMVVANKVDIVRSRFVKQADGERLAAGYGARYTEVSVGMNHNCDQLLVSLLQQIRLRQRPEPASGTGGQQARHSTCSGSGYLRKASRKCKRALGKVFGADKERSEATHQQ